MDGASSGVSKGEFFAGDPDAADVPDAVVVPVDPGVQHSVGRGGDDDGLGLAGLADHVVAVHEDHAVVVGVGGSGGVHLGSGFAVDPFAEIHVGDDDVPSAVGKVGVGHRRVAEVVADQIDHETGRIVGVVQLDRVVGQIADAVAKINSVGASRCPRPARRSKNDPVVGSLVGEGIVPTLDQFFFIAHDLHGLWYDRIVGDPRAVALQADDEIGERLIADDGHRNVEERRVGVDSGNVVVRRVDQEGGRSVEVDAVDGAAILEGVLTKSRRRRDVWIVRPQLTEVVGRRRQDGREGKPQRGLHGGHVRPILQRVQRTVDNPRAGGRIEVTRRGVDEQRLARRNFDGKRLGHARQVGSIARIGRGAHHRCRRIGAYADPGLRVGYDVVQDRRAGAVDYRNAGVASIDRVVYDARDRHRADRLSRHRHVSADLYADIAGEGHDAVLNDDTGNLMLAVDGRQRRGRAGLGPHNPPATVSGGDSNADPAGIGDAAALDDHLALIVNLVLVPLLGILRGRDSGKTPR